MNIDPKTTARRIRARKREQAIAHGAIWGASILTISILFLIIGFIVVRGFYSTSIKNDSVLSYAEHEFDGLELVVNSKVRLSELPYGAISDAVTGEYIDWANLSEQGFDLIPCLLDPESPDGAALLSALGVEKGNLSLMAEYFSSYDEVLDRVAAVPGGLALVPSGTKLPAQVKRLSVKRLVFAANPSVTQLENNIALKLLTEATLGELLNGTFSNWKELGGRNLPVTLVAPTAASPASAAAAKFGWKALVRGAGPSADDTAARIAATEGAAGVVTWKDAQTYKLPILKIERVAHGPNLNLRFLYEAPKMSGRVGGISTIIINTLIMIVLTLLIATPIGVAAAIYLVEYAKQGRLVAVLRIATETLSGIPSIIFGLFGMLFFVNILGWGIGVISGVLTLTLMIMPTIVRTAEEALKTVPLSMREGSFALGATKLQTILRVVVPAGLPGIMTGVILALGRAVGETAALIFTMGSSYDVATNLASSARVLAVHIYLIIAEGISMDRAFSTATVLVFTILGVNLLTVKLMGRINSMSGK